MMTNVASRQSDDIRSAFKHTRYVDVPFPAYRFAAGLSPHPTEHPLGHSYGVPAASVAYATPQQWRESTAYLFGVDCYNFAYWWEAHESWEGLWRLAAPRGTQNRFLQGLIQLAAAHLKLFLNRPEGVVRLRQRAQAYLTSVAQEAVQPYMGVDLPGFLGRTDCYFGSAPEVRPQRARHDPAVFPYIRLLL